MCHTHKDTTLFCAPSLILAVSDSHLIHIALLCLSVISLSAIYGLPVSPLDSL